MGLAIIGGTIVSTALTLFVVPCIYLLLTYFERGNRTMEAISDEKVAFPLSSERV